MIKTVIFDIGKVLVGYDWMKSFTEFFGGDTKKAERAFHAYFDGGTWDELDRGVWTEEQVLQSFIDMDPEFEEELRYGWSRMNEVCYQYDFTKDWINELKSRGYQVLCLSNWSDYFLRTAPETMDFLPLLDGGILSYREKLIKPDPAIYHRLAELYNLNPAECIFLDDRIENIRVAQECGYKGIVVKDHEQAVAELEEWLCICRNA